MTTRSKPIVEKMTEEQLLKKIENLEEKIAARDKENLQIRVKNYEQRTKINDLKNQNADLKSQITPISVTKDVVLQTESNSDYSGAESQVGFQALEVDDYCFRQTSADSTVHLLGFRVIFDKKGQKLKTFQVKLLLFG